MFKRLFDIVWSKISHGVYMISMLLAGIMALFGMIVFIGLLFGIRC